MAIKDVLSKNIVADVWTIDGLYYESCDIPSRPLGDHDRVFSFWRGEDLMVIPIHQIKAIKFAENK